MKRLIGGIAVFAMMGLAGAAALADDGPAADKPVQPTTKREQREAAQTRAAAAEANTKLVIVDARKASREGRHADAARLAHEAQALMVDLPENFDRSDFEIAIEGILARAEKAGVKDARGAQAQPKTRVAGAQAENEKAAATPARPSEARRGRYVTTTIGTGMGDGAAIDVQAIADIDHERVHVYQGQLSDAYRSDELRRLIEVDEARVAPEGDVSYPGDWAELSKKREQYRGGLIARSKAYHDKDGHEWHAAIYDISALTYVPPDFAPAFSLDPVENFRNEQDRWTLRERSQIFRGDARDLAEGIPLLRFFGGVDEYALRGPKYSQEKAQEIVEMIKAVTTPSTEPKVIMLGQ